jgi:hypothetical protein
VEKGRNERRYEVKKVKNTRRKKKHGRNKWREEERA